MYLPYKRHCDDMDLDYNRRYPNHSHLLCILACMSIHNIRSRPGEYVRWNKLLCITERRAYYASAAISTWVGVTLKDLFIAVFTCVTLHTLADIFSQSIIDTCSVILTGVLTLTWVKICAKSIVTNYPAFCLNIPQKQRLSRYPALAPPNPTFSFLCSCALTARDSAS